jgi:hypothetical protein
VSLITLRKGAYEGLALLAVSCAAAGLLGFFVIGNYLFALGYALVLWLPVWLISVVLREGRSLSLALEISAWLGALAVTGIYLYRSDAAAMWLPVLNTMFEPMLAAPGAPVEQIKHTMETLAHYMAGVMAASSVSGLLLGLLLARYWQAVLYFPGGFRQEFLALNARPTMAYGSFMVLAVGMLAGGPWSEAAWNIAVVLLVLYTFIGTAVVHALLSATKAKRFLLPAFYILLIVAIPQILVPLTALTGFSDTWLNLRKRLN